MNITVTDYQCSALSGILRFRMLYHKCDVVFTLRPLSLSSSWHAIIYLPIILVALTFNLFKIRVTVINYRDYVDGHVNSSMKLILIQLPSLTDLIKCEYNTIILLIWFNLVISVKFLTKHHFGPNALLYLSSSSHTCNDLSCINSAQHII